MDAEVVTIPKVEVTQVEEEVTEAKEEKAVSPTVPPIGCMMYCEFGFVKDGEGNDLCECQSNSYF